MFYEKAPKSKDVKNPKEPSSAVKQINFNGLKWIDIVKPNKTHIDMLKQQFNFHDLLLEDCLTEHQRPKVDDFDDYCFIVLHLPRFKKETGSLDTEEVDIFIGSDYLVTLHEGELKPLTGLAYLCSLNDEAKKEYMSKGSALLLYEIIKRLFNYCFPMLDKIDIRLSEINRDVFTNVSKTMLESITKTKMQIINYRRVIKPLRPVILMLEKVIPKFLPAEMDVYFDDITDKMEKIWDMLENHKEVIESVDGTFSALTNQRINNLMRTFTVVQVVTLPMVLVGGLFSMNVEGIPLHLYPGGFWIVFGMILIPTGLISSLMVINRKKWF